MLCTQCNNYNADGTVQCAHCGANLATHGQQAQGMHPGQQQPGQQQPGMHPGQQQPGMHPGQQQPHYYAHGMATRTSGMAIAGFVLSFFCALLGLIFSIIGYNECKNSNGTVKGEGLAMAGIIISICMMVLGLIIAVNGDG